MLDPPVLALLRLEAYRAAVLFRRAFLGLALVAALFMALFGSGPDGWAMVLGVLGASHGMVPALRALPDKLDGSLDFLTSLPVRPRQLATAHLISCAGYAVLAAAAWTGAVALAGPSFFQRSLGPAWHLATFAGLWMAATLLSSLVSGMVIRFPLETVSWLPAGVLLSFMGVLALADELSPHGDRVLLEWLLLPRAPLALFSGLVFALALGLAVAHALLTSGFAHFRPRGSLPEGALP